jgi:hypothetical protein
MPLSKAQILAAPDRKTEDVPVPEWGGDVRVRSLDESEYDAFMDGLYERKGKDLVYNRKIFRLALFQACVCDDDGNALFTAKDVEALKKKSASAFSRVIERAQVLVGISRDDVEELTSPKNSGTGPDAGSSSS